jgi:hypothetical protein
MAHATMNFHFESIAPVSGQQAVEFGVLYVVWHMRLRGMKDPNVSRVADEAP